MYGECTGNGLVAQIHPPGFHEVRYTSLSLHASLIGGTPWGYRLQNMYAYIEYVICMTILALPPILGKYKRL